MITDDTQAERSAQLLQQANLHRMRQEWDEAITSCMQVLYAEPNSWRAHALLGDIYADQKRVDEAIRWYCMTLDIRPDSNSTKDKLNHLVASRRQEFVESLDPTRPLADRTGKFYRNSLGGKLSWQWSAPERKKRLLAASFIAAVILLAVAVPVLSSKNLQDNKPVFQPGKAPTTSTFFLVPAQQNNNSNSQVSSQTQSGNSGVTSTESAGTTKTTADQTASTTQPGLHDSNESNLITSVESDPSVVAANVHIADAEIDPPTNTLSITYTCNTPDGTVTPDQILRNGLVVGKAALSRPEASSLQTCVLRCLTVPSSQTADAASIGPNSQPTSQTPSPTLAFVGTLPKSALSDIPSDKVTDFQIGQLYTNIWWAQAPQASQPQNTSSVTQPSPTP